VRPENLVAEALLMRFYNRSGHSLIADHRALSRAQSIGLPRHLFLTLSGGQLCSQLTTDTTSADRQRSIMNPRPLWEIAPSNEPQCW
jgi:hypothetical protein